jgi:hypothetical protein
MRDKLTQVSERPFEFRSAIVLSLVLAVFLDLGQFLIFECSSLPGLSLLFGLFAFAPIYLIPVGVSVMRRKRWHGETRLSIAVSISIVAKVIAFKLPLRR